MAVVHAAPPFSDATEEVSAPAQSAPAGLSPQLSGNAPSPVLPTNTSSGANAEEKVVDTAKATEPSTAAASLAKRGYAADEQSSYDDDDEGSRSEGELAKSEWSRNEILMSVRSVQHYSNQCTRSIMH